MPLSLLLFSGQFLQSHHLPGRVKFFLTPGIFVEDLSKVAKYGKTQSPRVTVGWPDFSLMWNFQVSTFVKIPHGL